MEEIVAQNTNIFLLLKDYPLVFILYVVSLLIITFLIIIIKQPKVLDFILFWKDNKKNTDAGECASIKQKHEACFKGIEGMLHAEAQENKRWREEFDGKFNDLAALTQYAALQACAAITYNPNAPSIDVFKTAIWYFKHGGNGGAAEKVAQRAKEDRAGWQSELNADMRTNGYCNDPHFRECIARITKRLE